MDKHENLGLHRGADVIIDLAGNQNSCSTHAFPLVLEYDLK